MAWSVVATLAIALVAAWLGPWVSRQLTIDRCLDSGGAYDEQTRECLLPASKPSLENR